MKRKAILILVATMTYVLADARQWTGAEGSTWQAEVVWVSEDREVKLKNADGGVDVLPLSAFSTEDIQYLDQLLFRKIHGEPHPVPWQEMNTLFGLDIWKDTYLWDDLTADVAKRTRMRLESKTDFIENYRAYPLGKECVLHEPVYATVLYGGEERAENLCFVFLNQGDIPLPENIDERFIRKITADIKASATRVHDVICAVLGEPQRDSMGKGNMREEVWLWDWNEHAIILTRKEGKYVMLRILPSELADRSGEVDKFTNREIKERMKSCVIRRGNGDVVVSNIPMIDQGPKGYCSPATWERYLRYLGIPADMYQLANVGNTGIGGGTYLSEIIDATKDLLSHNGRSREELRKPLRIESIAEYIDLGMPIMWSYITSSTFQKNVDLNTARRNGKKIKIDDRPISGGEGGHICLIIGYNEKTQEFAISDSWGSKYKERWVPIGLIHDLDGDGVMNVIKW